MVKPKRFKVTVNYSHKRIITCQNCFMEVSPGKLYFSLVATISSWGSPDCRIHFCKECWDKMYDKYIKEYETKKDKYGEYLKGRIVKVLR